MPTCKMVDSMRLPLNLVLLNFFFSSPTTGVGVAPLYASTLNRPFAGTFTSRCHRHAPAWGAVLGLCVLLAAMSFRRRRMQKRSLWYGAFRADFVGRNAAGKRRDSLLSVALGVPGVAPLARACCGVEAEAEALLAQSEGALAAGALEDAYVASTRGLVLLSRHNDGADSGKNVERVEPGMLASFLRIRRAEALLARGFAQEAVAECALLPQSWSVVSVLRGTALLRSSEYAEGAAVLTQALSLTHQASIDATTGATVPCLVVPLIVHEAALACGGHCGASGILATQVGDGYAADAATLQRLAALAEVGARHRRCKIDFAKLVETIVTGMKVSGSAGGSLGRRLPPSMGPLRFESPKVARQELGAGRGRGVVAVRDMDRGEAFIFTRPLGLVLPGDSGLATGSAPLSERLARQLLADQLEARARRDAHFAEELFSLYSGSADYSPSWTPQPWNPASATLPQLSLASRDRIEQIIRFNSHRCPGGRDPNGNSRPGLGLWLWPPMVNHALEADGAPNCAHVFVGDAMLFRTTLPVRAGEELLDRYTSPLAPRFEQTLDNLQDHGMQDAVYEDCAKAWASAEGGRPAAPFLPEGQLALAPLVSKLERVKGLAFPHSRDETGGLLGVPVEEYQALKKAYRLAAEEARKGLSPLKLAPTEVRALELLCALAAVWEGRGAALEMRTELARRVQEARPFHFSALGLWAELYMRLAALPVSSLDAQEEALAKEAESHARAMASFWLRGFGQDGEESTLLSDEQFTATFLPWIFDVYGFGFGWFSTSFGPRLARFPSKCPLGAALAGGTSLAA